MAHFDPTAHCFLNQGDEICEGNKEIDRDEHTILIQWTCLSVRHRGLENKSEILFVLKLMRIRLVRAARLLKSSDDVPNSFTAYYYNGGPQ